MNRLAGTDGRYEFETYKKFSLAFYTVLMGYADELQAVSVDEALIDVTSAVTARAAAPEEAIPEDMLAEEQPIRRSRDPAVEVAEQIRDEVRGLTQGCEGESLDAELLTFSQYRYIPQYTARQAWYTTC